MLDQERNQSNQVTAQLVRDGNIGGILSRTTAAGATFYDYDGNGNVTLLTDSAGNDVGHYRYDAFGNTLEATGPRAAENPWRFSTKELHGGWYNFGYRFYAPDIGRWINRDPISEAGGVNLYGMVGNNPVNAVDAHGLAPRGVVSPTPTPLPPTSMPVPVVLTNPFTGKLNYKPLDSAGIPLTMPTNVDIMANIISAQTQTPGNLLWFKNQVGDSCPWDYKKVNPAFEDFGNFHYGVVGRAMGISRTRLLDEAGVAQIKGKTSKPGWGTPNNVFGKSGTPPYGDDPKDQMMIKRGMDWYDAYAKAKAANDAKRRYGSNGRGR